MASASTVGLAPTNVRKLIDPSWFGWSTKHEAEHVDCDPQHDRAVFAAGYLIGGGQSTRMGMQLNPAMHDVARLMILMLQADEESRPTLEEYRQVLLSVVDLIDSGEIQTARERAAAALGWPMEGECASR
jgi:hypothetical protein